MPAASYRISAAQLSRQHCRDLVEVERCRSGQEVANPAVSFRVPEDHRGHITEVAHVNERCAALPRGQVDAVVLDDVAAVSVGEVLREEPRPQGRPRQTGGQKMRLHPVVRHNPVGVSARHRREHDMLDAGPLGGVEERVQGPADANNGRRPDQEQAASPAQRGLERRRHGEVEVGYRHTRKDSLQGLNIRPCRANSDPGGGQGAGDRSAQLPVAPVTRTAPLTAPAHSPGGRRRTGRPVEPGPPALRASGHGRR